VRIRQATLQNHKNYKRVFGLKSNSNILSLPYPCKLAELMVFDELDMVKVFEKELIYKSVDGVKNYLAPLAHPIIISELECKKDDENEFLPLSSLRQLIDGDQGKQKTPESTQKNLFRCRLNVNAVLPEVGGEVSPLNFLKVYNTKTG